MKSTLALPALLAVVLGACAGPRISDHEIARGRAAAATEERAETLAMWLEGDFEAASGRELHVRRMPEFGRALHVVEVAAGSAALNEAWIVVAEGDSTDVHRWRITRPERYAGAWKDEARLKELTMYDLRRIEGGEAAAEASAGAESFAFAAPEALTVKVDAGGIVLTRGEVVEYRRTTPLRDARPTP